jgi:alpha-L-fucosidase
METMKVTRREFVALAGAASIVGLKKSEAEQKSRLFTSEMDSLTKYQAPEWFRDAKLGIWACWGPESVPEMGDWYARNMYVQGHEQYEDHLKRYGHPSKMGYKDIVPLWKGENWDPDRLMRLYKKAGAKYFCAIAQHHDNIDCWNSRFHEWNSVKMGPKKDIIGIWRDTARKHGLRFGVTEHLGASWNWLGISKMSDTSGPLSGVPYDGANSAYDSLYHTGNATRDWKPWYSNAPESFQIEWFNRIKDLLDSHQPDLLYSDGSLPFGRHGRELLAHFYNSNAKRLNGKLEAVYNCKKGNDGGQYADGMCVEDLERGVADGIKAEPWQTDTCVGDWYYKRDIKYKTPTTVIQMLIDIVSKNGNLLLNLPLRGDGTLDSEEERILADLAEWTSINGEGIYGTRPWRVYGEGSRGPTGGKFNEGKLNYTSEDIRFTTRGRSLYAFALAWPTTGKLLIRSLAGSSVSSVRMIYGGETLNWTREADGLAIQLPGQQRGEHAFGLIIEGVA